MVEASRSHKAKFAASQAERCSTAAWDMQKFFYNVTKAGEVKYANLVQIERN